MKSNENSTPIRSMFFYYHKGQFYKKTQDISGISGFKFTQEEGWAPQNIGSDLERVESYREVQAKQWVLLKKTDYGWLQDGPYSSEEVFLMLKDSRISPESPIWKKGFQKWTPLKQTETFAGLFQDKKIPPSYEVLDQVMEVPAPLKKQPSPQARHTNEEKILKEISFSLEGHEFLSPSVHLEGKSIRALPNYSPFIFRSPIKNKKRLRLLILGVCIVWVTAIALIVYKILV